MMINIMLQELLTERKERESECVCLVLHVYVFVSGGCGVFLVGVW